MAIFPETRWSLITRAGSGDSADARRALDELLGLYSTPVDRFLRALGVPSQEVPDVRQGFFLDLLTHDAVRRADPGRRFRSFLLGALKNHLGHLEEYRTALKRWTGKEDLSLEQPTDREGARPVPEPQSSANPEREFLLGWVESLVKRALDQLKEESLSLGGEASLQAYQQFLTTDDDPNHERLAAQLGTTVEASRARLKRLRRRFHELLRSFVAETVYDSRDVNDELSSLLS